MAKIGMGGKTFHVFRYTYSETDIVHTCVLASLALSCTLITIISFSRLINLITYPLFFIPIIYASYFYPKRGLLVAGICATAYLVVGYYYNSTDLGVFTAVTLEAILFIIVASVITYFIERIQASETRYRSLFVHSQLGIVLFNRAGFSIRQTNEKFSMMLHFTPEELKAMTFSELFLNPREKERFLERIGKQPETTDFETRFVTKEGHGCWVNLSWSPIDNTVVSCTAINITGRKLVEKSNNNNMMKYRQLTENSPTSILILQNGSIRYSNPAFTVFSGYQPLELIGKDLFIFVDARDQEEFNEFAERWSGKNLTTDQGAFRFVTKSGKIKVAELFTTPITHFEKPATLINLIDISERQRLEEKIQLDNERRRGIIITVAHELRTPLQPILGYLNLLIQDPQGFGIIDDTKKILERCLLSVDRERQIINQMLELSVLESGKLSLSYSTFLLATLIKGVLDTSSYPTKGEVAIDVPDTLTITADMDRLYVVLDSLLSNAINFSKPPREILIFYRSGANDKFHHVSVRDNGIGIPENAFSSIFEPFQLADAAKLSRRYDRIGLSLSIAKKILLMHGGDITVESSLNVGSTFTIHLPKEVQNAP